MPGRPIFILGVMPRSGTNFLHRLICRHPRCGGVHHTPVKEDFLVHHADRLSKYITRLHWQWAHWGAEPDLIRAFSQHLGQGLIAFLQSLTDAERVVTKTPSVRNIDRVFTLFPEAHVLVIVRDGRSVVASGMSGFGWDFEEATRTWARAARRLLAFQRAGRDHGEAAPGRHLVVKYEALSEHTEGELRHILDFLGLDVAQYDFAEALDMPVYGSSFMKDKGEVTWEPQSGGRHFDGTRRWQHWDAARHRRFNWIAGEELEALGYTPVRGAASGHVLSRAGHVPMDAAYHAKRLPARLLQSSKAAAKAFLRSMKGDAR